MKAPDKIYVTPVGTWNTEHISDLQDNIYIRKDAMLEWATKKFGQVSDMGFDDEDVEHGYTRALEDIIDKINSL